MNDDIPAAQPVAAGMRGAFADLTDRWAVVTGASSGIGREIAWELARGGAHVVVHYCRNQSGAEETAAQIADWGRQTRLISADFSQLQQLTPFVEDCYAECSPEIWVNNAGVDLLTGVARQWTYAEKLQKLLDIDVRAALLLSKAVAARMQAGQGGAIIHIGWDQAERGMEGDSGELFAVAKNAIMGFTRSLAVSVAPQVRVNCVAPGWIKTAWGEHAGDVWQQRVLNETPLKRWGLPEDIARLVRFLVSEEARYITGQVWYANGGAER